LQALQSKTSFALAWHLLLLGICTFINLKMQTNSILVPEKLTSQAFESLRILKYYAI